GRSPASVLRIEWELTAVAVVGFVLVYGLSWGLPVAPAGVFAAACFGMSSLACVSYRRAASSLALDGRLPWRLMGFLTDMHAIGVLRISRGRYQFRHIELQRSLAAQAGQDALA